MTKFDYGILDIKETHGNQLAINGANFIVPLAIPLKFYDSCELTLGCIKTDRTQFRGLLYTYSHIIEFIETTRQNVAEKNRSDNDNGEYYSSDIIDENEDILASHSADGDFEDVFTNGRKLKSNDKSLDDICKVYFTKTKKNMIFLICVYDTTIKRKYVKDEFKAFFRNKKIYVGKERRTKDNPNPEKKFFQKDISDKEVEKRKPLINLYQISGTFYATKNTSEYVKGREEETSTRFHFYSNPMDIFNPKDFLAVLHHSGDNVEEFFNYPNKKKWNEYQKNKFKSELKEICKNFVSIGNDPQSYTLNNQDGFFYEISPQKFTYSESIVNAILPYKNNTIKEWLAGTTVANSINKKGSVLDEDEIDIINEAGVSPMIKFSRYSEAIKLKNGIVNFSDDEKAKYIDVINAILYNTGLANKMSVYIKPVIDYENQIRDEYAGESPVIGLIKKVKNYDIMSSFMHTLTLYAIKYLAISPYNADIWLSIVIGHNNRYDILYDHIRWMMVGLGQTGKSDLVNQLKKVILERTMMEYQSDSSKQADNTEIDQGSVLTIFGECPNWLCEDETKLNGQDKVNLRVFKEIFSQASCNTRKTFKFHEKVGSTKKIRAYQIVKTFMHQCVIALANVLNNIGKNQAMPTRFIISTIRCETDTEINYRIERRQNLKNIAKFKEIQSMLYNIQKESMKYHFYVNSNIVAGPNLELAFILICKIMDKLFGHGIQETKNARDTIRVILFLREIIITRAILEVFMHKNASFYSTTRDYDQVEVAKEIEKRAFFKVPDLIRALGFCSTSYVDPMFCDIIDHFSFSENYFDMPKDNSYLHGLIKHFGQNSPKRSEIEKERLKTEFATAKRKYLNEMMKEEREYEDDVNLLEIISILYEKLRFKPNPTDEDIKFTSKLKKQMIELKKKSYNMLSNKKEKSDDDKVELLRLERDIQNLSLEKTKGSPKKRQLNETEYNSRKKRSRSENSDNSDDSDEQMSDVDSDGVYKKVNELNNRIIDDSYRLLDLMLQFNIDCKFEFKKFVKKNAEGNMIYYMDLNYIQIRHNKDKKSLKNDLYQNLKAKPARSEINRAWYSIQNEYHKMDIWFEPVEQRKFKEFMEQDVYGDYRTILSMDNRIQKLKSFVKYKTNVDKEMLLIEENSDDKINSRGETLITMAYQALLKDNASLLENAIKETLECENIEDQEIFCPIIKQTFKTRNSPCFQTIHLKKKEGKKFKYRNSTYISREERDVVEGISKDMRNTSFRLKKKYNLLTEEEIEAGEKELDKPYIDNSKAKRLFGKKELKIEKNFNQWSFERRMNQLGMDLSKEKYDTYRDPFTKL